MDLFRKYHGEEALKDMLQLRNDYNMYYQKESEECKELLYYYREFIRMVSNLSEYIISSSDSISLITFIDLMMKLGYFSHGKQFTYSYGTKNVMNTQLGVSVITGNASCKQISGFASDVFEESLMDGEKFYCLRTNTSQKQTLGGNANHVANVIEYNGIYYVYDITYQMFFAFRNPIELISNDKSMLLYYKPQVQLATEKVTLDDIETRLRNYKRSSGRNSISLKELNEIQSQVASDITANTYILRDFEADSKDIKKKIYTLSKTV